MNEFADKLASILESLVNILKRSLITRYNYNIVTSNKNIHIKFQFWTFLPHKFIYQMIGNFILFQFLYKFGCFEMLFWILNHIIQHYCNWRYLAIRRRHSLMLSIPKKKRGCFHLRLWIAIIYLCVCMLLLFLLLLHSFFGDDDAIVECVIHTKTFFKQLLCGFWEENFRKHNETRTERPPNSEKLKLEGGREREKGWRRMRM